MWSSSWTTSLSFSGLLVSPPSPCSSILVMAALILACASAFGHAAAVPTFCDTHHCLIGVSTLVCPLCIWNDIQCMQPLFFHPDEFSALPFSLDLCLFCCHRGGCWSRGDHEHDAHQGACGVVVQLAGVEHMHSRCSIFSHFLHGIQQHIIAQATP